MRVTRFIVATTVLGIVALPAQAIAKSSITMSGSTSVAPLAAKLAKGYLKEKPNSVTFRLLQGGSDIGVSDVSHGRVTIGNSSRDPLPSDPGGLVFNRIARDGVCIATSPKNPLSGLSQQQVQDIFSGRIRSWSQIPGAKVNGSIDLVVRNAASGTQDAFQNIFMGQDLKVASSASPQSSNGRVQSKIHTDDNAIGYVDFNFTSGLSVSPYKGVACSLRNAKSGQYGGLRNFWMVTRGAPSGAASKWIRWIRGDSDAKKIIAKNWVPLQ